MVLDIKMCRFDNVPWGFRLVGGSDFEYPLTVVKVTEGSIAEEAGLQVGDVIVRVNDTATSPLTHDETNKLIKGCGNVFYFGVYRENADELNVPKQFPVGNNYAPSPVDSYRDDRSPQSDLIYQSADEERANEKSASPMPTLHVEQVNAADTAVDVVEAARQQECLLSADGRPCSVLSENTEIKMVEEEIAAVLSGESEVLQEHNVMGIFPKPGVCMTSDVLRSLNEEAIKTKAEKDKENKKWSTFLQKPNRPIPKSKAQLEAERRAANAYKVKIVKSAPIDRERTPPPPSPKPVEPVAQSEPVPQQKEPTPPKEKTPEEVEEEQPMPTDNEVPNLLEVSNTEQQSNEETLSADNQVEKTDEEKAVESADKEDAAEELAEDDSVTPSATGEAAESAAVEAPPKTAEELALEQQLADVQKQLAALSNLPSTIQSTLDAVTKQLAELLPAFKLQQQVKIEAAPREISLEKIDEHEQDEEEEANTEKSTEMQERSNEQQSEQPNGDVDERQKQQDLSDDMEVATFDNKRNEQQRQRRQHDEQHDDEHDNEGEQLKKQKKYDVIEELEEHLERKSNRTKRSKRAFGPLTPSSERPLVLPGGRRWYRPKDAYNDEFIAETLSAQAELITGTTLGVNFMKYQKPERRIDLNRSEVYKVIHHLDRQPVRGIEVRPPVVPAEVDVRKAVHS